MSNRHFVFLQGMPCPFFTRVGRRLAQQGCRVTGINLCVGDWLFWRGGRTVNYRGRLADWPVFIADFFERHGVTDLVLLGEQRRYHKEAVAAAQARGIRVMVTDFGYLRPDWITLERDGMTGNSRFPRNPGEILKIGAQAPPADLAVRYHDSALKMALGDLLYSFSNVFLGWLYPHYRSTLMRPYPFIYFPAMGWRLLRARAGERRAQQQVEALIASKARYFLFPLQLEHDFQIMAYSPFEAMRDAMRIVIQSFARHAEADVRLVMKVHPWDPGLKDWRRLIAGWARDAGVADRVDYLEGGSLDLLIRRALGMVTINSTSGIRALQLGCPVKVLGQAMYDVPGLTHQGGLDTFWTEARQPDPALAEAFINAVAATLQIRGVFFNEPGLTAAVDTAVARLVSGQTSCA
jgi:capsular polysaccharide export protein